MIATIEEARMTLQAVEMTVAEDQGEEMVESAWSDLVHTVAEQCTPEVRQELLRREGLEDR